MTARADKDEFFRQATLKICGDLEIEKALFAFLNYIRDFVPAGRVLVDLYDHAFSSVRCIATATPSEGKKLDILSPLSEEARAYILSIPNSNQPVNLLLTPSNKLPWADEFMTDFKEEASFAIVLILHSGQQPTAGILLLPASGATFTEEHLELLTMLREPLTIAVSNAVTHLEVVRLKDTLKDDNSYLQGELRKMVGDSIVGANFGLNDVLDKVHQVASLDSPVLLLGETGVGKDVIANAIHNVSHRAEGPFISVNCGAIPESLIDSELFGHEKGAFTGALAQKRGRFERASGGTIFLDEIGELPPPAQVRLLKVLQDKTIERVGGTETIVLDIRIIAATNRNLEEMVKNNSFREDLWFRLNVFPIHIPPLRERKSDIPALLRHFLMLKSKEMNLHPVPAVSPGSIEFLLRYDWPGNVRELQNIVERGLILNPKGPIDFATLQLSRPGKESTTNKSRPTENLDTVVTRHIREVLASTNGRIHGPGGAAEILGVNPSTLRNRMKNLGIPFGRNAGS